MSSLRLPLVAALATLALATGLVHAQAPAPAPADLASAEVRRIDPAAGKITLKHGEIRSLDMPPMTMVFQVRDKAQLEGLKPGDAVRFTADKVNGAYTVTHIEAAR